MEKKNTSTKIANTNTNTKIENTNTITKDITAPPGQTHLHLFEKALQVLPQRKHAEPNVWS